MSDSAIGTFTPIPSATASSLALTGAHLGKYIKVKVTGTGNYTESVTSNATAVVEAADPEPAA